MDELTDNIISMTDSAIDRFRGARGVISWVARLIAPRATAYAACCYIACGNWSSCSTDRACASQLSQTRKCADSFYDCASAYYICRRCC